jgi:hypothetical protein
MTIRSKMAGAAALFLLMTGTALAQNPGMMSPPFYNPPAASGHYTAPLARNQVAKNHRQAFDAQAQHSMVQTAQRHQNG